MALTEVRKRTAFIAGKETPLCPEAEEGFPWLATCNFGECPWGTFMGGWRDAYDFAEGHARQHLKLVAMGIENFPPQFEYMSEEDAWLEFVAEMEEVPEEFRGRWLATRT